MSQSAPQLIIETKFRDRSRIEELLDRGADVDAVDGKGRTALMWAASWGRHDIVQLLLERGAQADIRDAYGETALMKAARRGRRDIVETLLSMGGADSRICDSHGKTALDKAVEWGKKGVVELFTPSEDAVFTELMAADDHARAQAIAPPISESDLLDALDETPPETAPVGTGFAAEEIDFGPEGEAGPLHDTIEVMGLSLFDEEGERSDAPPREVDINSSRMLDFLEAEQPSADRHPSDAPSEDELMALFDSFDEASDSGGGAQTEEERQVATVDLSEEAEQAEDGDDWALAVAGEEDDLLSLDEDFDPEEEEGSGT